MADTHHAQGPGKSVLGIGQELFPSWLKWWKHVCGWRWWSGRGKSESLSTFTDAGPDDAFAAFGLMSLMVLIIWAVDPQIA